MSSIASRQLMAGVLAIAIAAVLGCGDSSSTGPTPGGSPDTPPGAEQGVADVPGPDSPVPDEGGDIAPPVPTTPDAAPAEPAAAGEFGIGSPAPPLAIAEWVHGQPVDGFEPGEVYVVEFWATWCGPCLASMPHVSQLQEEYGDAVTFVGVSDETEPIVAAFLEAEQSPGTTWAEALNYRLAIDAANATTAAYMEAADQSGIPTAFVVGRDTKVEWIGHPMTMDEPLAKIVAGEWDRQAAIEAFEKERKLAQYDRKLGAAIATGDWDEAFTLLDQAEGELGKSAELGWMRLSVLVRAGRTEDVEARLPEVVDLAWNSADTLNQIAWVVAIGAMPGDLDLALKAATRASELQEHRNASILDTLARVYYEKGQLDEAIEWQKKAVEHGDGNPAIKATLDGYEAERAQAAGGSGDATDSPAANVDEL